MGTAIYVYDTLNTYVKNYINDVNPKAKINESSMKVLDLYIRNDDKLWIVIDNNDFPNRSNLNRSITYVTLKNYNDYKDGNEILVTHGKIKYNKKENKIVFFGKLLGKSKLELRVDRFNGDMPQKDTTINNSFMFFDIPRNRLTLILDTK